MSATLSFLGGAGTVTGSRFLLQAGGRRVLVDCGLFQGYKQLRLRNWARLGVDPGAIDAVVLTHAHIDHCGYLPVLIRNGFGGRVHCSAATRDLCAILLPDSGFVQERDAEFANRHCFSRHHPAQPLYTEREAEAAMARFRPLDYGAAREVAPGIEASLEPAGHILGSAIVRLRHAGGSVVFSGDLGRPHGPLMPAPTAVRDADHLVLESTYGGRRHPAVDPAHAIAEIVQRTAARGGTVLVPAFAVGRAQLLMYYLHRLKRAQQIPDLPVYLDSPMAIDASGIFCNHPHEHRLSAAQATEMCRVARYVRDVEASKAIDRGSAPAVVISASGMATGGRVLHHLKRFAPDARATILFAGYQAGGTRGAAMLHGAGEIKIHGEYYPVRAEIQNLDMLSAHADEAEIMGWLRHLEAAPRETFLIHGEPDASDALRRRIEESLGWRCAVPEHGETREL
jgi:metallo-beta-lactamase family protein